MLRISPRPVRVGFGLVALFACACTPDAEVIQLTGSEGLSEDTGFTDTNNGTDTGADTNGTDTDSGSTSDTGGSCTTPAWQCVDLLACLAVVLPDTDVTDFAEGGACWCNTLEEAIDCRDLCISQLAIVEQQYPNVEECGGTPTTGDGDGDGDPGLPNLVVYQFYLDAHDVEPGQSVDYTYEIGNDGLVDTLYIFQNRLILSINPVLGDADDIVFHQAPYEYIVEANQSYPTNESATIPDDLPPGEYYVAIELDYTDVTTESNETDNALFDSDKVIIAGVVEIDLAPSQVTASETAVKVGASTDVSATIDNLGLSDVGPYTVRFYYSSDQTITTNDTLLCSVDEAGLAANTATVVADQCVVPALAGDYYLGVIVDPTNVIAETDETNNTASDAAVVTISPLQIDLQPSAVGTTSFAADVDDFVGFSATVSNNGVDPSPAFAVRFYYSSDANITTNDHLICQANGPALQPGASTPINTNCDVPLIATGNYRVGVIVDPANAVAETDEANNAAVHPSAVSITAPNVDFEYDYHGDDLPFFAQPGQDINYNLDIWNYGTSPSPAYEAKMVWSLDANITNGDILGCTVQLTSIPAQTKTHYVFACSVPNLQPGQYYSGVIIDPTNAVPETLENNNVGVSFDTQIFQ